MMQNDPTANSLNISGNKVLNIVIEAEIPGFQSVFHKGRQSLVLMVILNLCFGLQTNFVPNKYS